MLCLMGRREREIIYLCLPPWREMVGGEANYMPKEVRELAMAVTGFVVSAGYRPDPLLCLFDCVVCSRFVGFGTCGLWVGCVGPVGWSIMHCFISN